MNCFIKRVVDSDGVPTNTVLLEPKIPRPPNAFMLYANEKRKSVAQLYPTESNKDISKRLGTSWRALQTHEKVKYYERAKAIDLEHKKKYPNYVYNPKEARIRKAMREATRDRSIGASPMLPRPSARRPSHGWVGAHEELMMSPMSTMRGGGLDCYPMSNGSGNNQFLPPMNTYNKLEASLPPANAMHNSYMQPNPLAQLQQQTDMWNNYSDGIRPRSSGNNSYMMQDVPSAAYQTPTQQAVLQSPLLMEKHQRQTHTTAAAAAAVATSNNMCMTPPHSNENIPPDEANEKAITKDTPPANDNNNDAFETKHNIETVQPLMESNNVQHHHHHHQISDDTQSPYIALYDQQNGGALGGKVEDIKMKKTSERESCVYLPLSNKNFCASPKLSLNDVQYQKEYITKYLQSINNYESINVMGEDGIVFPYVTLNIKQAKNTFPNEIVSQPNYVQTDVGCIPIFEMANGPFTTDNVLDLTNKNKI